MKIAVIDTTIDGDLSGEAQEFLPKLFEGLCAKGHELHLITKHAPNENVAGKLADTGAILHDNLWNVEDFVEETAPFLAKWLNDFAPDVYLIWTSADIGWVVLPLLSPKIATVAAGQTDSEFFYQPARHYRAFLTRVVGVSPEVCIGFVLSSVIDKEKVEWIPFEDEEIAPDELLRKTIKSYENCFEKAIEEAANTPREQFADYPLMAACRSRLPLWLRKLRAKMTN